MIVWILVILFSVILGTSVGIKFSGKKGIVLSIVMPWLALLLWLLFTEYILPHKGGGASMWPIAQLFGGTVAAVVGLLSYLLFKKIEGKKS